MKFTSAAAAALLALSPALAAADGFLVDFERQWNYGEPVDNTYSGLGVSFVNVLGLSNDADFTYYSGAPSPLGTAFVQSANTTDRSFMNVVNGSIAGALNFFYSTPTAVTGAIRAYSGLNGDGALLGTYNLASNDQTDAYNTWTAASFAFAGAARSFDLTGSANVVGFDNISAVVTPVPEPSAIVLMLVGGAGMLRFAARRRRS